MAIPAGDIDEAWGYTVRYDAAKAGLRVYATAAFGVVLITAGFLKGSELLIALGLGGLGVAYYFYPLAETKRARLGANEYGIFIEGFGLVGWRSIRKVDLVSTFVRNIENRELLIQLNQPVSRALLVDWRRMAFYRMLMRLPWTISGDNTIHVLLEPFAEPPQAIHRRLESMWRHYRA